MSQQHLLTKQVHLILLKEKITGEALRKLWLPLVLIMKKVFRGLCFCTLVAFHLVRQYRALRSFFKLLTEHCQNLYRCTFNDYDFGQRFSLALILLLF